MAGKIETRLSELRIELPAATAPVANFVPCVQTGNLLYVSGQVTAFNGEIRHVGKVGENISLEEAVQAARVCALNVLSQARAFLGDLDRVVRIVQVQGFVNAVPDYRDHPKVVNGASDLFVEVFGDAGKHARFAVGVGSLPLGVSVEVAAVLEVK
ncbi:RidA family protein [Pendulispora rubella]|uniref:RidA family protein n=1 Tax=Pendulispora rubella TaxID=2741070 RepID=A0ABZ2L460_9BACT